MRPAGAPLRDADVAHRGVEIGEKHLDPAARTGRGAAPVGYGLRADGWQVIIRGRRTERLHCAAVHTVGVGVDWSAAGAGVEMGSGSISSLMNESLST